VSVFRGRRDLSGTDALSMLPQVDEKIRAGAWTNAPGRSLFSVDRPGQRSTREGGPYRKRPDPRVGTILPDGPKWRSWCLQTAAAAPKWVRLFETVKKVVIPSQCAHWRGNPPVIRNIFNSENADFPKIRGIATSELLRAANLSS